MMKDMLLFEKVNKTSSEYRHNILNVHLSSLNLRFTYTQFKRIGIPEVIKDG